MIWDTALVALVAFLLGWELGRGHGQKRGRLELGEELRRRQTPRSNNL